MTITSTDKEVLQGLIAIIKSHSSNFKNEELKLLRDIFRVVNDAEFEAKHPRDRLGRFTESTEANIFDYLINNLDLEFEEKLTGEEINNLLAAGLGKTYQEIADDFYTSYHTSKSHISSAIQKTKSYNKTEAITKLLLKCLMDQNFFKKTLS